MKKISVVFFLLFLSTNLEAKRLKPVFSRAACEDKNQTLCSDTSILKIYLNRFAKECVKKKGIFKPNASCNKSLFQPSYCTIPDLNFQIYYSKTAYPGSKAKEHCLKQTLGAYSLIWVPK